MTKIKTEDLREALSIVKPGLANKEIIEQSTSFAFIDGTVATYNDEISISCPVPGVKFTGAAKAEELYQLLNRVKKDEIELEITDTEIKLRSGRGKASLTLKEKILLPLEEIGEITDWEKLPKDFIDHLSFVVHACSNDMSRPTLTGVHITSEGALEATDSFRIARSVMSEKLPIENFVLPANSAAEVIRLRPTEISVSESWAHFRTEGNAIISCRIYNDKFPDVTKHMKVKGAQIILPKTIKDIIDRASVFSKRDHFLDEKLLVTIAENRITIKSESDTGKYEEQANLKYDKDPLSFLITPYILQNIIMRTQKCIVGQDKIRFEDSGWEYICMLRSD